MPFNDRTLATAQEAQRDAAQCASEQVRVVAGPGTGKSRCIEQRVGWLIQSGVPPEDIAIISFTNASVRDLRERITFFCRQNGIGGALNLRVSTLHSLALYILRRAGFLNRFAAEPVVLGDYELKHFYDPEFGVEARVPGVERRRLIRTFFEAIWSTGNRNAPTYTPPDPPISPDEEQAFEAYHEPSRYLYSCVLPGEIVKQCVDRAAGGGLNIAQLFRVRHLIVDEYQDLSPVDIQFVDILADAGASVFVAGDDDQSIYSFRHGSPVGIQQFPQKYPGAGLFELEHCFRCPVDILAAAENVVQRYPSPGRIPKQPLSMYADSDPRVVGNVFRWSFGSGDAEAAAIAESCASLIAEGVYANDILILFANFSISANVWPELRDEFDRRGVPYDEARAIRYEGSEGGEIVRNLLKLVCNREEGERPKDIVAHRMLLGSLRGVGAGTCNKIRRHVMNTPGLAYLDLFYRPDARNALPAAQRRAVATAAEICERLREWNREDGLAERINDIAAVLNEIRDERHADDWRDFAGQLPGFLSLQELRAYMDAAWEQDRNVVLQEAYERAGQPAPEEVFGIRRIRVLTMHGAKGLSAHVVFVPGLEHGLLPSDRQANSPALLLEAGRLLFVSITRARAACILSYARSRWAMGNNTRRAPSQFLEATGGTIENRIRGLSEDEVGGILATMDALML